MVADREVVRQSRVDRAAKLFTFVRFHRISTRRVQMTSMSKSRESPRELAPGVVTLPRSSNIAIIGGAPPVHFIYRLKVRVINAAHARHNI